MNKSLRQYISLPYKIFIEPLSRDEEERHLEIILNSLVSIILAISLCFSAFSICTISSATVLLLSRKGHVHLSAHIFVGMYFLITTYNLYHFGAELPSGILHYAVVIIISKVLIGTNFGIALTAFTVCALVGLGLLQAKGLIPTDSSWKSMPLQFESTIENSIVYISMITVLWLSNRGRRRTFEKKSVELYRFAEFGKLSSGIFHDLINPLTSISLVMENLRDKDFQQKEKISEQIDGAIRASKKMESFLRIAKKQLRSDDCEHLFSVRQETGEAARLLEYKMRSSKVSVDINIPEDYRIYGNPLNFFRIMMNLISNAIDSYDSADNKIPERSVTVSALERRKNIEISVKDNGCGIPDHVIESCIFKPFFTTKAEREGIGIGLSMIKRIVENDFKGTISVGSKSGKGSVFTICLPIRKIPDCFEDSKER